MIKSRWKVGCAIIPAAGLGTRMLPITKSIPKEMLPIGTKPMIQYSVEEAIAVGIRRICIIINDKKSIIKDYFLGAADGHLKGDPRVEALNGLRSAAELTFIYQPEPKGVADAMYLAKDFVGDQPFALMLPDNIFFSSVPAIAQVATCFEEYKKDITACIWVTRRSAPLFGNCGRIDYEVVGKSVLKILRLDDKKSGYFPMGWRMKVAREVPRRIFLPHIFEYIDRLRQDIRGELDDVPVFQEMVSKGLVLGCILEGRAFDAGNPNGYRAANSYVGTHLR